MEKQWIYKVFSILVSVVSIITCQRDKKQLDSVDTFINFVKNMWVKRQRYPKELTLKKFQCSSIFQAFLVKFLELPSWPKNGYLIEQRQRTKVCERKTATTDSKRLVNQLSINEWKILKSQWIHKSMRKYLSQTRLVSHFCVKNVSDISTTTRLAGTGKPFPLPIFA